MKKKLNKLQAGSASQSREGFSSTSQSMSRGQWERRLQADIHTAKQALSEALSPEKPTCLSHLEHSNAPISCARPTQECSSYASSTENIARLLKGWIRNPAAKPARKSSTTQSNSLSKNGAGATESTSSEGTQSGPNYNNGIELSEALESLFGFESFESSNSDISGSASPDASLFQDESKPDPNVQLPLSLLEKWLFDESASTTQGKEQAITSNDVELDPNANFFST